jgi:hypothetical protein
MCVSSLLGVDDSHLGGEGGGLSLGVFAIFYSHQKAIISVIKLYLVGGLDELYGVNFSALLYISYV